MKLSNPFVLFGYEGPARDGCCAPSRRRGRCKLRSPASSSRGTAFSASSGKTSLKALVEKELVYPAPDGYAVYDRFLADHLRRNGG